MSKVKYKVTLLSKINETELITLLVKLLKNNWEEKKVSAFLISIDQENTFNIGLNLLQILEITLYKANSTDLNNFILAI